MDCMPHKQREHDIMHRYFEMLKSSRMNTTMCRKDILHTLAVGQAPRFYVTYEIARRIISRMERKLPISVNNKRKKEMYDEIYKRYSDVKKATGCIGYRCLDEIITSPAPSFYVSDMTMQGIIYRSLRRKRT